jgi:hypothetical protein
MSPPSAGAKAMAPPAESDKPKALEEQRLQAGPTAREAAEDPRAWMQTL